MVDIETNLNDQPKKKCSFCDTLMEPKLFIIPIFGFSTQFEYKPKPVGDSRPSTYYATQTQFWGAEGLTAKQKAEAKDKTLNYRGKEVKITYSPGGKLFVLNQGVNGRGLHICPNCGYAKDPLTVLKDHKHDSKFKRTCSCKKFLKASLGQVFSTDILKISLPIHNIDFPISEELEPKNQSLSVLYAILEGASKALDISRGDISGCVTENQELVLFDDTAGGSGFVKHIYQNFDKVLREALNKVSGNCGCTPETSCYGCLRNYSNQFFHDQISRGLAKEYINWLINAEKEVSIKPTSTNTSSGKEEIGTKTFEYDIPNTESYPDTLSQFESLRDSTEDDNQKIGYERLIKETKEYKYENPISEEKLPAKERDIWPELFWPKSRVALFTRETKTQYDILKKYNWYCYIVDENIDGRYVQIKITQRNSVVIKEQPDFLLVLQLEQNGDISEFYNGPGYLALEIASEKDSYNHRHMQINRLIEQSRKVDDSLRIEQKYPVPCLWKTDKNYKFADNISLKKTESVYIDRFKESKKKIAEANKKHLFDDDNLLLSDIKSSNFIEIWDRKEEKKVCDCGGKLRTSSGIEVYFHSENEMVSVLMDGEKCLDCNKIFVVKDKALDCIRQINEISVEIKNNNKGQVKFHL